LRARHVSIKQDLRCQLVKPFPEGFEQRHAVLLAQRDI
jgi:hypothetical protein